MFYVFVDTQAFERDNFAFDRSTGLVALANAVADGNVTVLLTDVTEREIREHIADRVVKALSAVKGHYVLHVLSVVDFEEWTGLREEIAVADALSQWDAYRAELSPTMISVDLARPSVVMDAFFALRPPFSAKKRTEFRDAFVLEALRAWAEQEQQQVIVVSGDKDHKNACDGDVLVHAETIRDGLALTLHDEVLLEAAQTELEQQGPVLVEQLQEAVEGLPVTLEEDYDADIESVTVSDVKFEASEFELVEVRRGHVLVSGPASVTVEVAATVADYDNGSRDEGDWAYLPYNEVTYIAELDARLTIRLPFAGAPIQVGLATDLSLDEPTKLELSASSCEVRVRKHWSEGDDEPDADDGDEGDDDDDDDDGDDVE